MTTTYALANIARTATLQLLCLFAAVNHSSSQNIQVAWSSFNAGFAESRSSNAMVKAVAGQSLVGTSQQANTQITCGFLADTLIHSVVSAVVEQSETPSAYSLEQNYPNPFNPETRIEFRILNSEFTRLAIYDLLGREIAVLVNGVQPAGFHSVTFDASGLTSGMYLYRLTAGEYIETKRLLVVK
jgi:hypothetical protein